MRNYITVNFFAEKKAIWQWFFYSLFKIFIWFYLILGIIYGATKIDAWGYVLCFFLVLHILFTFYLWIKQKTTNRYYDDSLLSSIRTNKYIKKAKNYLKVGDWGIKDDLSNATSSQIETKEEEFTDCKEYMSPEGINFLIGIYKAIKKIRTICQKKASVKLAIYGKSIMHITGTEDDYVEDTTKTYKVEFDGRDTISINEQYTGGYTTTREMGEYIDLPKDIHSVKDRYALATAIALKLISVNNEKKFAKDGLRIRIMTDYLQRVLLFINRS